MQSEPQGAQEATMSEKISPEYKGHTIDIRGNYTYIYLYYYIILYHIYSVSHSVTFLSVFSPAISSIGYIEFPHQMNSS